MIANGIEALAAWHVVQKGEAFAREQTGRIRGSLGQVLRSSTVWRLLHFATVLALMPSSMLSGAIETYDRCIAALTACVVVALP